MVSVVGVLGWSWRSMLGWMVRVERRVGMLVVGVAAVVVGITRFVVEGIV